MPELTHLAMPKVPGVYCIRHESGRIYVGSSRGIRTRMRQHLAELREGEHHCLHLQRAWHKYGELAFAIGVLEVCLPEPILLMAREQAWLDRFHKRLYNCRKVAMMPVTVFEEAGTTARARQSAGLKRAWENRPAKTYICRTCGAPFESRSPFEYGASYCSRKCEPRTRCTRICAFCGAEFVCRRDIKVGRYCGKRCSARDRERSSSRVLSDEQAVELKRRIVAGESHVGLAREFGIAQQMITAIKYGEAYVDVPADEATEAAISRFVAERMPKRFLSQESIDIILARTAAGDTRAAIAKDLDISRSVVLYHIRRAGLVASE